MRTGRIALTAVAFVLLWAAPSVIASSKYACDYSNRLCQWNANYLFGATVMGDLAFFNGGILSNDASTPVNGSALEVLDLRTMSPLVIQVENSESLQSQRYRHQLVVWKGKILAVGGQADDSNGASQQIINVIELDLNTRQWELRKQFTQPGGTVQLIFDASVVVDDQLLVVFENIYVDGPARQFLSLNLNTKAVNYNYNLANGAVAVLDWPLIGVMTLGTGGDFPHLVVQSKRQLPKLTGNNSEDTVWFEVTGERDIGVEGPLPFTVSTTHRQLSGGTGGKALALTVMKVLEQPTLMTWAVTTATFVGGRQETVNAVSMYNVKITGAPGKRSVALQLSQVFLTLPFNMSDFSGLTSVDLPWHGNLALGARDVTALPYIGNVDVVGDLDSSDVNIQAWQGKGLIIRGSSLPDPRCQPIASWRPFVLTVDLAAATPAIRAVSNSTWCSSWSAQTTAAAIVGDAAALETSTKLYAVETPSGLMLSVLVGQRTTNPGGQLLQLNKHLPLRGALISVADSRVQSFNITKAKGYNFPQGIASCMSTVGSTPIYLETGGWYYDDPGTQHTEPRVVAVPMQLGKTVQPMLTVAGAADGRVFSALACSPDGTVYSFGGLEVAKYNQIPLDYDQDGKPDTTVPDPVWAATNSLHVAKLDGSVTAPTLSKFLLLGSSAAANSTARDLNIPGRRAGHTLTYLPPGTAASLGLNSGALLLYGGSNLTTPTLTTTLTNESDTAETLSGVTFDRTAWLFDLGTSQWMKLQPDGLSDAPPGLMYHSAAVQGKQVMLWGGLRFVNEKNRTMRQSNDLYVLDFSISRPRWRKAGVDNINVQGSFQLAFPNTGIAALPQSGVVALMHEWGISLTAIPQSSNHPGPAMLANWGLNTLNLTDGDWFRLEIPRDPKGLTLQQPMVISSDAIITGVNTDAAVAAKGGRRSLSQQQQEAFPVLECGRNATVAVSITSSGAVLERLTITGCNGSAVNISVGATGAYTLPATLRNLRIISNNGTEGAAVVVGPAAAAVLENCSISSNIATDSVVLAQAGSNLTLIDTVVMSNQGSGVASQGAGLNVTRSSFINNTAKTAVQIRPGTRPPASTTAVQGGALRITCETDNLKGCNSKTTIINSSFAVNSAESQGGAVYLGAGTFASLEGSNFTGNAAGDGGAVFADRDSCLYNMTTVRFRNNNASSRGGAMVMRDAGCRDITWQGTLFYKNTAGAAGGAIYIDEMINRNFVGQAAFNNNTVTCALNRPTAAVPSMSSTCNGGALYFGLWNSMVTLYNTSFVSNSATGSGGAIEVLSINSTVNLINSTALGNVAGPVQLTRQTASVAARSEGGAVHVQGSWGALVLVNVNMTTNRAGRGGAVSLNSNLGSLGSTNSSFTTNLALTAGGAVAVTERKDVSISNTTFLRNRLLWPDIAAGGGFYCFLCHRVAITSSRFELNVASYGGGAALLQASGPSSVVDTIFEHNWAKPNLLSAKDASQRRRSLLAATQGQPAFAGQATSDPSAFDGLPADILGLIAGNTTGDKGLYAGGGGLYVSVTSRVDLNGSCFEENIAWNGGGLLALTDACPRLTSNDQSCQLVMSDVSISEGNLADAAGGGLLVTETGPSWVQLADCTAASSLNSAASTQCLQQPNKLCRDAGVAAAAAASAVDSKAGAIQLNYMATSAAHIHCQRIVGVTDAVHVVDESCSTPVRAGPGIPINIALVLRDGLNRTVSNGTYDASMPLQASLYNADGTTKAGFAMVGSTTRAVDGTAYFSGLKVLAEPGSTSAEHRSTSSPGSTEAKAGYSYQLVFSSPNGLSINRTLIIRQCQAGERTTRQQMGAEKSITCELCNSPAYSLYPQAPVCGDCALLGDNLYSVCNLAAVVPASGVYQSHPRNPLLHRCITAAACSRRSEAQFAMANWAAEHADQNITQLNQINSSTGFPHYQQYVENMCSAGYMGPLCGACKDGFGHSGQRCVKCIHRSANSFIYFLVCLFMFIVPALQTLLHSKNVQNRHQLQRLGSGDLGLAKHGSALSTPLTSIRQDSRMGWVIDQVPEESEDTQRSKDIQMVPAKHQQLDGGDNGSSTEDVRHLAHADQMGVVQTLTPYMSGVVPPAQDKLAAVAASSVASGGSNHQASSHLSTAEAASASMRPLGGPGAEPDSRRPHIGKQQLPAKSPAAVVTAAASAAAAPAAHQQPVQQPSRSKLRSWLAHLFSTEAMDRTPPFGPCVLDIQSMTAPGPPNMPGQNQVDAFPAAGPAAATAAPGDVYKSEYYHTDVMTMLVSYMQLLGLLRLIRVNWSQWMEQVLKTMIYIDFTSGASIWVSVECSFAEGGLLPKSLKRSLVLMLWPLGALMFLGIIWLSYAFLITRNRRLQHSVRHQFWRLEPYMVLSAVTMLYFLYTPTSREIISLFSCQPVDTIEALNRVAVQNYSAYTTDAVAALVNLTPKGGWQGVWTSDTNVMCSSQAHLGVAIGLGIPGLIVWVFGLPIMLWIMLKRDSKVNEVGVSKLEDPMVELKYGLMYDKYRHKRYYWECVVLLENCALTMLLVLLQAQPASLQILVAMAVIFIGIILHITFKPYVVKMLDTLRRLALYSLMGTLFFMMLVSISEFERTPGLPAAALSVIVIINLVVVLIYIWAIYRELKRWALYELGVTDRDYLACRDIRCLMGRLMQAVFSGGVLGGILRRLCGPSGGNAAGAGGDGIQHGHGSGSLPVDPAAVPPAVAACV